MKNIVDLLVNLLRRLVVNCERGPVGHHLDLFRVALDSEGINLGLVNLAGVFLRYGEANQNSHPL